MPAWCRCADGSGNAASSTQINVMVNTVFASQLGDGPVFWLIAFRLCNCCQPGFGVALGTVSLPCWHVLLLGSTDGFRSELARSMRLSFLLTIPATIGLMLLAEPIISVLYQHGKFSAVETAQAAGALRFYAVGLCGYATLKVLINAFYAIDKRKTPMVISFVAVGLNLCSTGSSLSIWAGGIEVWHFPLAVSPPSISSSCMY
jgi:putative peptidoglycan lipid II flippase